MPESAQTEGPGFVAIGASAGGLEALQAILEGLPPGLPFAFLVSTHMAPAHASHFSEILQRSSRIPVREAVAGETPAAGVVLVGRPDAELVLDPDGKIAFLPIEPGSPHRIDTFFRSLVPVARSTVAIVLSGTGTDGAEGALALRKAGASVIAQSRASAKNFGMPGAAIENGAADQEVDARAIPALLIELAGMPEGEREPPDDISDVLKILRESRRTDFERYRAPMLHRRIRKRMAALKIASVPAYAEHLRRTPGEVDALFDSLLINVTEFFRDPEAWSALEEKVIPELASRAIAGDEVRVWVTGCATGEEVYSLAILLAERVPQEADGARIKIFATDLDASALMHARAGRYSESQVALVSPDRRARFFRPTAHGWQIVKALRRMAIFGVHDLTRDPPIGNIDLATCRNVLIYLEPELQQRVIDVCQLALRPGGYLFLGRSEDLPRRASGFTPLDRKERIYRRDDSDPAPFLDPARSRPIRARPPARTSAPDADAAGDARGIGEIVLATAELVVLGVSAHGEIRYANAYARHLLGHGDPLEGKAVDAIVAKRAGQQIRDAVAKCIQTGARVHVGTVSAQIAPGTLVALDVRIEPARDPGVGALLLGHNVTDVESARGTLVTRNRELGEDVSDLQRANEELQRANEDLVTVNEELQSTNEELSTLSEEVQSTNEELETTNEELQSTNEELGAVNAELQRTSAEASRLNAELRSLLEISSDAIVICDANETVTFLNRRAQAFFGLAATDALGKNIHSVDLHIEPGLIRDLFEAASRGHEAAKPRVRAIGGREPPERWGSFTADVTAAENEAGDIEHGWILSCRDISEEVRLEAEIRRLAARHATWIRTTRPAALFLRPDGTIEEATQAAKEILGADLQTGRTRLWALTPAPEVALQLKGALAGLTTHPDEHAGSPPTLVITLRSGARVLVEFARVDAPGEPPLVLLSRA